MTAGYAAARLSVLARPFDADLEQPAAARAERRLAECLALDPEHARAEALRSVLLQRERRLHESLLLEADPARLRELVLAVEVDGLDALRRRAGVGLLLVSLHYGPYSSLLWPALAKEGLSPLHSLIDLRLDPNLVLPDARLRELEEAGVVPPGSLERVDRGAGGPTTARGLAAVLAAGDATLVLPDAYFLPPGAPRSLAFPLGRRTLALPRGVEWLARRSGCAVAVAWIRPEGSGHRVVVRPAAGVDAALATLARDAVVADPAPWEGWLRDQPGF